MKLLKSSLIPVACFAVVTAVWPAAAQTVYPQVNRAVAFEPVIRACTQLEMSAGLEKNQCGTLPLSEIVKIKAEAED